MPNDDFHIAELMLKGYKCSHIMVQIGLDHQSKSNPALLQAMSGLANGMASGLTCGILTGGCCLIAMYAGLDDEGREHERLPLMLDEFTEWFRDEFGTRYSSIDCASIMQNSPRLRNERCPEMIRAAVAKAREILESNGFELDGISGTEQG